VGGNKWDTIATEFDKKLSLRWKTARRV